MYEETKQAPIDFRSFLTARFFDDSKIYEFPINNIVD